MNMGNIFILILFLLLLFCQQIIICLSKNIGKGMLTRPLHYYFSIQLQGLKRNEGSLATYITIQQLQ